MKSWKIYSKDKILKTSDIRKTIKKKLTSVLAYNANLRTRINQHIYQSVVVSMKRWNRSDLFPVKEVDRVTLLTVEKVRPGDKLLRLEVVEFIDDPVVVFTLCVLSDKPAIKEPLIQ